MIRDTSREAFQELVASGEFGNQKGAILEAIRRYGPQSRNDLERTTGIRIPGVCGAVNALIEENQLQDPDTKIDPDSRKRVHIVELKEEKPMADLFTDFPEQPDSDDPRAQLFKLAPGIAKKSGRDEASVRKQLGSMMRQHEPAKVLGAIQRSAEADDPLTYARALLRGKRNTGVQDGRAAFLNKGD